MVLGTYRMVPSQILGADRRIVVRVPRGYEETTRDYPVIYKLHGSSSDFLGRIAGQLGLLAASGEIPEAILVGIEQHGHSEMLPRGYGGPEVGIHAEEFMRFLIEELVPFVDRGYRTTDLRLLLGTYDCGLFALYTMLTVPEAFDAYLTSCPAFNRGGGIVLERARIAFTEWASLRATLHITHRENPDGQVAPEIAEFLALLKAEAPVGLIWAENCLPIEAHDSWAPYVSHSHGLLTYFGGFKCPLDVLAQGLSATRIYYKDFSRRLGSEIAISARALFDLGVELSRQGRWKESIEALELLKQEDPKSLDPDYLLGRAYRVIGDFDRAIESYQAALQHDRCPPFLRGELEAIESSAALAIERAIASSGLPAGMEVYRQIAAGGRPDLVVAEGEFNEVGYRLLGRGLLDAAIAVFTLAVTLYPESANAYDSLGEAYMVAGEVAPAIANYRKSLELDASNDNAARMLRRPVEEETACSVTCRTMTGKMDGIRHMKIQETPTSDAHPGGPRPSPRGSS